MRDVVEELEAVALHDRVTVELDDGTTVAGTAAPVEFDQNNRLRIELRPDDAAGSDERYELAASVDDGEWSPVRVRRQSGDEDWAEMGEAVSVTRGDERQSDDDGAAGSDDR
ncbi:hypothetical protein [Candidatus Halobonum tyrrellensis]|uniref:Uncharacterized protein n=1 Tax=Candidatus Halobonum tyrrellensis G22 TaxID=1324957 RepID=V4H872_9EURY|nr:hypothetical protein [Candidatus Halobonum tyrrellensis]ESP86875.1 hypothetical protein K933_16477 [Candidatus Halobonum tyrrellensis G22]